MNCPDCGTSIAPDAPAGLCIPCLLRMAQEEPAPTPEPLRTSKLNRAPRDFGDYELLREIGRGGMGVVYEARQRSLARKVALKVILAGEFAAETAVARFAEESRIIGRLDHPNIVPIYEVGEEEGRHYYSMKLIAGQSLARHLDARNEISGQLSSGLPQPLPIPNATAPELRPGICETPRHAVDLLIKVARAVHFVHQRGIIHRDLSPENILLDADGEPWVADFGLARLTEHDRITRSYTIVGKPDYMAPEQADPAGPPLSILTDVFSLGAVFYEMLTRHRPFAAPTPLATLHRVCHETPAKPSLLNPAIDHDLDIICLKSLAKEPARRYESAAAFASDLERWQRGEPILARPSGRLERAWKWTRRHPLTAALVLVSALAIIGQAAVAFYFYNIVIPKEARAHPSVGWDQNIRGFAITFETGRIDRATMNFDPFPFNQRSRQARLYFTNVPPAAMSWVSTLRCQVIADTIGIPDEPRGPIVRHGETFLLAQRKRRDRAFYVAPFGWLGQDILARAPDARLCIILLDPE